MAKLWSGLKKRLVVDIGSSAVRVCELSKTKTGYEITRFAQREYNSDPSLEEQQRKELRATALKEALKAAKVKKGKIVLGVPGQSVFTRCRTLPPVPEYKVSQIVRYEIQQQIPFGLDQIAMDYQILNRTEQGGYDVMMAAIKVDVVEKHIDPIEPLKCSVAAVDVLPLASYNWVRHQGEFGDQGECVALINIGASTTDIVIERGNQFRFTRPLNAGGNDITRAIAEAFNMDFVSAERIKRERAFAPTGDPQKDGTSGEVIGRVLERMAGEIQRSFSYFRSQPGGGQVNKVLLIGGGARLKNLVPYLRKRLDMDVRIAQTLKNVQIAPDAQSIKESPEQVSDVLGMALRACDTVTIDVDLIPPRILAMARRKEQIRYWVGSVVALILIFLSMVPAASRENELVKARIDELKEAIRAYDPELALLIRPGMQMQMQSSTLKPQIEAKKRQVQTLSNQVEALDKARGGRRFWLNELMFINDARPALGKMWFSSIESAVINDAPEANDGGGGRAGRGGAPGGDRGPKSAGFPGINPPSAAGQGTAGISQGPLRVVGDVTVPWANGMIIHGFAESDEVIKNFVKELSSTSYVTPSRKYVSADKVNFAQASVQRVPWEILYEAPTGPVLESRVAAGSTSQTLFSFTVGVRIKYSQERPNLSRPEEVGGDSQ
jgi:type IV pilus assembly protein PilM